MNIAYGRNFYAMSDSAVHEELEEIEQENTVKYFFIARKHNSNVFFWSSKWDRISLWKGNLNRQGRSANEEGLLRTTLNFLSYLPRIKL